MLRKKKFGLLMSLLCALWLAAPHEVQALRLYQPGLRPGIYPGCLNPAAATLRRARTKRTRHTCGYGTIFTSLSNMR